MKSKLIYIREDEQVVPNSSVDYCVNKCISKEKIRRIINECQEQLGETHSGIRAFATLLKQKLEIGEETK
jgi:hypothetical protein